MNAAARRPVVTLAALYGAGGSIVGPRLAERLGVPFLDREIPHAVARQTGLSRDAVADVDDAPRTTMEKLFSRLGRAATMSDATAESADLDLEEHRLRRYAEEFLARSSTSGGVMLGRGGVVVLRAVPWALHVHLSGPREARIRQGMALQHIDRATAEQRQQAEDEARIGYVSRAYGIDGDDPSLYHLILDSTALDLDACVELIIGASQARLDHPRATPTT